MRARAAERSVAHAWSPLYEPLFRSLWIAAVISFTGSWMQNVGAGWLMTTLTMGQARAPLLVGLVQAANALPVFLIALPAGALADLVDRRRLLLATQVWMTLAAAALGALTLAGKVTPWMLLAFTFVLGLGAVMNDPAWQAITPEIVSQERFASAVALNSAGFNVARAVGPALGGVVVAVAGSGTAFMLNALSFLGVIGFLLRWQRRPHVAPLPKLRLWPAVRAGLTYMRRAPAARAVLVRTGVFSLFASALWAMLPLISAQHGSVGYGLLLACLGFGAVMGAALLPLMRRALTVNVLVAIASVVFGLVTLVAGIARNFWVLSPVLLLGGVAWISILASLNLSAQTMSPGWVRARAISMYLLVLQGGMAAGGALWGALAGRFGIETSLAVAALGLAAGVLAVRSYPLRATWTGFPAEVTPPTVGGAA